MQKKRVVVLISGSGSNLQAIIDASTSADYPAEVVAVISNRPQVKGLERAQNAGIQALTLDHKNFESREGFDQALCQVIDQQQPDLVVLAGFMRILTEDFVEHYLGRLINIHPSLLPKYPGLHTHQRAIESGDSEHGATVHFVTAELDGGPAIIQASVAVLADDNEASLAARVQSQEHVIYPKAVEWFCQDRLNFKEGRAWLDGTCLPETGEKV